jgi:hypothetical protein
VQEQPVSAVAHRTSPTNMGLALLANLSAYDFGYLSAGRLVERTTQAFQTMAALERHWGHFYNWYDTQSLRPLLPLYLSSVDSGNLAGHLLTLRPGLLALLDQQILGARCFDGLADTLGILVDVAAGVGGATPLDSPSLRRSWQCQDALDELTFLAPWVLLPASPSLTQDVGGFPDLEEIPTLRQLARFEARLLPVIEARRDAAAAGPEEQERLGELRRLVVQGSQRAQERLAAIDRLARAAGEFARPQYDFLFDETRHLLAIGYNVDERRRDASYYDLLASEARLGTFVAIAQGELPQGSWFALGRLLTSTGGEPTLLSWSGSMFEYLMPLLVMPTYEDTLLDHTYRAAVARQIEYGRTRGVPWGISESGYNAVDVSLNYQYRAFGVPSLGLKRGLAEDLSWRPMPRRWRSWWRPRRRA